MTGKKHKERETIQRGLLNYPEVQLSVTSRQLSSVLPTKVFLCGSSEEGWGVGGMPGGGPSPPAPRPHRVLTDNLREVIKISKPRRPLNQTKNTSAVKGNSSSQWEAAIKAEEAGSATASRSPQYHPHDTVQAGRADGWRGAFFTGKQKVTQRRAVMI